jgi:hypothetical protein
VAFVGVVENGLVRPLDNAVKVPEHFFYEFDRMT